MTGSEEVEDSEGEWSGEQTSRVSKEEKILDGCGNGISQGRDFFCMCKMTFCSCLVRVRYVHRGESKAVVSSVGVV